MRMIPDFTEDDANSFRERRRLNESTSFATLSAKLPLTRGIVVKNRRGQLQQLQSQTRKTKQTASVSLGLVLVSLGIWSLAQPVLGTATSGERKETFEYYQDGKTGRGRRRVLVLDLGDGVKMEFVRVPAGTFQMGSPPDEKGRRDDEVQHTVELTHDFYLGKYEVTRGQFRSFVNETRYRTEPETDGQGAWGYDGDTGKIEGRKPKYSWRSTGFAQTDEHPVVNVTWNDADAFCSWLAQRSKKAMRLPTEAEWEYAARAGSAKRFYSGDSPETLVKVGNVADGTAKKKVPG